MRSASNEAAPAAAEVVEDAAINGRIRRVSIAVLFALALAFVVAVQAAAGLGNEGHTTDARLGGDFPAFYAAGAIALDGDWDELYSSERQAEEQELLGLEGFLSFAYPPHVAMAFAPFAAVGFRAGYAIHTALMVAAAVGALWVLRPVCPPLRRWFLPACAATLAFYPLFRAVGGGQNAAVTLLLFAVVWRALADDREVVAGLAVGLLLYRPQYALPLIGLLLVRRHLTAVASASAVAAATWAISAAVLGVGWVSEWLDTVGAFVELDATVNAPNSVSALGFIQALSDSRGAATYAVAAVVVVPVIGLLLFRWWAEERALAERMALVSVGVLLISPHTMFYDVGLLVLAAIAVVALEASGDVRFPVRSGIAVAAIWAIGFVQPLSQSLDLPATPLAIGVLVVFAALAAADHHATVAEVVAVGADDTRSPLPGKHGHRKAA